MFGSHDLAGGFVADQRYYWPLVPLAVLIAYSVATFPQRSAPARRVVLGTCGRVYVAAYILMLAVYRPHVLTRIVGEYAAFQASGW
jgi:hypothetical protein